MDKLKPEQQKKLENLGYTNKEILVMLRKKTTQYYLNKEEKLETIKIFHKFLKQQLNDLEPNHPIIEELHNLQNDINRKIMKSHKKLTTY